MFPNDKLLARRKRKRKAARKRKDWKAWRKWSRLVRRRRATLRKRKRRAKPRIITSAQMGLSFSWVFGSKGTPTRTTGHYSAGGRARNAEEGKAALRQFHALHASKGWGGCSYDAIVADDGTLLLANPIGRKGAHVAGLNTGNVGVNCPGTTGDRMTAAQERTIRWYIANAHTSKVPKAYRSPRPLAQTDGGVHRDYNATACPGDMVPSYRKVLP